MNSITDNSKVKVAVAGVGYWEKTWCETSMN